MGRRRKNPWPDLTELEDSGRGGCPPVNAEWLRGLGGIVRDGPRGVQVELGGPNGVTLVWRNADDVLLVTLNAGGGQSTFVLRTPRGGVNEERADILMLVGLLGCDQTAARKRIVKSS